MRRIVSVGVFYILGGGYIACGKQGSSLAACLFLSLTVFVRDQKVPKLVVSILQIVIL